MDVCPPGLLVGWVRRGRGPDTPDGLGARDRARGLGASDGRGDNRDRCPLANARTQLEDGADLFRPDAHAREAEMAGRDDRFVETGAVIGDDEPDRCRVGRDGDAHLPRAGVLDDVVQCFLRDPVEGLLDFERQPRGQIGLEGDWQADPSASASRCSSRRVAMRSVAADGSLPNRTSMLRVIRVIENSAWVTES